MWHRAQEIGAGLAAHYAAGGDAYFMTRTIRHRQGEALADLWSDVQAAWLSMTQTAGWRRASSRLGVVGRIRVVEVTHGQNGWHVHLHVLVLLAAPVGSDAAAAFGDWTVDAWARAVTRTGRPAPLASGQDFRRLNGPGDAVAKYLCKTLSMGLELTHSQDKGPRTERGTHSVWTILRDAVDGVARPDADPVDLWHEWEQGSQGRKQIVWSNGLRDRLGLGAEATDESLVREDVGHDDLLWITPEGWGRLVSQPALLPVVLGAAEQGPPVLRAVLDEHGVEWVATDGDRLAADLVASIAQRRPDREVGPDVAAARLAERAARDRRDRLASARASAMAHRSNPRPSPATPAHHHQEAAPWFDLPAARARLAQAGAQRPGSTAAPRPVASASGSARRAPSPGSADPAPAPRQAAGSLPGTPHEPR